MCTIKPNSCNFTSCSAWGILNRELVLPDFNDFDMGISDCYPTFSCCNLIGYEMGVKRILGFVALFLFICLVIYHKMKYKSWLFNNWVEDSIFTIFDPLKKENDESEDNTENEDSDPSITPKKKKSLPNTEEIVDKFKQEIKKTHGPGGKNVYLFDWEQNFCLCCSPSWIKNVYMPLHKCFSRFSDCLHTVVFNKINLKYCSYYCVVFAFMFFRPMDYLFSFFLANPCYGGHEGPKSLFLIWDLFSSTIYTLNVYFLVTLIVLRRELQGINPNDKKGRQELFFFTFHKGLGFGILIFSIKLLLMANTGRYFPEIGSDPARAFYSLGRQLIFLTVIMKSCFRKRTAIKNDCDFAKEECKISMMKHFLDRNSLGKSSVFKFFQKEGGDLEERKEGEYNFDANRLKNFLDDVKRKKLGRLVKMFKINDEQNFQNPLLKTSKTSSMPKWTVWLLSLDFCLVIVTDVFELTSYKFTNPNDSQQYCQIYNSFTTISLVVKVLELFILPFLCSQTVRKINYFGKEEDNL